MIDRISQGLADFLTYVKRPPSTVRVGTSSGGRDGLGVHEWRNTIRKRIALPPLDSRSFLFYPVLPLFEQSQRMSQVASTRVGVL
jgi:hypothetical protein